MNKWLVGGVMMILVIGLIVVNRSRNPVPDDSLIIKKSVMDSINAIAKSIPDTILHTDTVPGNIVIRWRERPVPLPGKDSVTKDSLVDSNVAIYLTDSAGIRKLGYSLYAPTIVTRTFEITKKVPVFVMMPAIQKNWYTGGGIGNGVSVEIGRTINKIDYGVQIVRFDSKNCFLIKAGIRF